MTNRRLFLLTAGRVALAGPIMAGIPRAAQGQTADPVTEELMRQFRTSLKAFDAERTGESARRIASVLRLASAHGRSKRIDSSLKRELRRRTRTSLLAATMPLQMYLHEARELGFKDPPELFGNNVPFHIREQVLNRLLAEGITPMWVRGAAEFEKISAGLIANAKIQQAALRAAQDCGYLNDLVLAAEISMALACLFGGPLACGFATGFYIGTRIEHRRHCY